MIIFHYFYEEITKNNTLLLLSIFLETFLHSRKALGPKEGSKYNKEASFVFPCRTGFYLDIYLLILLYVSLSLYQQVANVSAVLFCRPEEASVC